MSRPHLTGLAALFAATALVFGCSSGSGGGEGEWTAQAGSDLSCTGEGIHPEGCPIQKPPPEPAQPPITPCPTGDTCSVVAIGGFNGPVAGCGLVTYLTQTGATPAYYAVSSCPTAAATAWVEAQPASWHAALATSVPTFAGSSAGSTYVTFLPPIPATLPWAAEDAGTPVDQNETWVVPGTDTGLPCTAIYELPSQKLAGAYFRNELSALCVESDAVDEWLNTFQCTSSMGLPCGILDTAEQSELPAPYGYTWIGWWNETPEPTVIGGGCTSSCIQRLP